MDNSFIERLGRMLENESIYLHELETGSQAREVIGRWVNRYNDERPHSSLADKTPTEAFFNLELGSSPGSCPLEDPPGPRSIKHQLDSTLETPQTYPKIGVHRSVCTLRKLETVLFTIETLNVVYTLAGDRSAPER